MEEELKARMEALTQVGSQVGRVFQMLTNTKQKHQFFIVCEIFCVFISIKLINSLIDPFYGFENFYKINSRCCSLKVLSMSWLASMPAVA